MDPPLINPLDPDFRSTYAKRFSPLTTLGDLLPLVAFFAFWTWFLWMFFTFDSKTFDSLLSGILGYVFISPLATGVWAMIRIAPQLQDLCSLKRREELALTQLDSAQWLSANIRSRLFRLLALSALNLLTIAPFCFLWSLSVAPIQTRDGDAWFLALPFIFAFGSMQICAIIATLMGIFETIEHLCLPNRRDHEAIRCIIKWSMILILSPLAVIVGSIVTVGIGAYLIPGVLLFVYPSRAKASWRSAVDQYLRLH